MLRCPAPSQPQPKIPHHWSPHIAHSRCAHLFLRRHLDAPEEPLVQAPCHLAVHALHPAVGVAASSSSSSSPPPSAPLPPPASGAELPCGKCGRLDEPTLASGGRRSVLAVAHLLKERGWRWGQRRHEDPGFFLFSPFRDRDYGWRPVGQYPTAVGG